MNREIRFRGKRTDSGDWVFGWLTSFYNNRIKKPEYFIQAGDAVLHRVPFETIGQFTGLRDKSGVEIYQGDIFKRPNATNEKEKFFVYTYYEVRHDGFCCFIIRELFTDYTNQGRFERRFAVCEPREQIFKQYDSSRQLEIVGNIYDSLELLEKEKFELSKSLNRSAS